MKRSYDYFKEFEYFPTLYLQMVLPDVTWLAQRDSASILLSFSIGVFSSVSIPIEQCQFHVINCLAMFRMK